MKWCGLQLTSVHTHTPHTHTHTHTHTHAHAHTNTHTHTHTHTHANTGTQTIERNVHVGKNICRVTNNIRERKYTFVVLLLSEIRHYYHKNNIIIHNPSKSFLS
jgi:ABC-type Zn2+ transport system substrate-binding protein/surface adhesin